LQRELEKTRKDAQINRDIVDDYNFVEETLDNRNKIDFLGFMKKLEFSY